MKGRRKKRNGVPLIKCRRMLAVLLLCAVLLAGGAAGMVSAYLYDGGEAVNTFLVRENYSEIEEPDFTPIPSLTPGSSYAKTVQVTNTKGVDCYVRARLVYSDDTLAELTETDVNTRDWIYDSDTDWYYYKNALSEGETTSPLMTVVMVSADATQEALDALGEVSITVLSESCQKGIADTYKEAWQALTE